MRYILYARKSTDSEDRQVQSLDAQERELMEIASKLGLEIVGTYRESMSAKATGRPIFAHVIKQITQGKADAILCWKLDRLARNFADGGNIIDLLQRSVIKEIRTYEAVHLPSDNVLMLAVQLGMANQYVRDLSVNVKRGIREKLSRGEWPNQAPLGYLNDKITKKIIIDKERAKYIKKAFYLYTKESKSIAEISDILFAEGFRSRAGKKIYKGSIARILSCTFYMGTMERDGHYYQGSHVPLTSKEVFDEARNIAEGKTQARTQTLFFPMRGFLTCNSCGCALTASLKKGFQYYYCTNGKKICNEHATYLREETLYPVVAKILTDLAFSQRKIDLTYKAVKERADLPNTYHTEVLEKLKKDLINVSAKESRLLDAFLDSNIDKETYDAKITILRNEKVMIQTEISKQETQKPVDTLEQVKKIFEAGITMQNEFIAGDDFKKHEILKTVLWNASIKGGKIITRQYKSPYQAIANSPKNLTISEMRGIEDSNTKHIFLFLVLQANRHKKIVSRSRLRSHSI